MRPRVRALVGLAGLLLASWPAPPLRLGRAGAQEATAPPPAAATGTTPEATPPPPEAPPGAVPEPTTEVPSPPAAAARDAAEGRADSERQTGWLDQSKRFLETGIFWPIIQLDRFFADDRQVLPRSPGSLVHWRQDLIVRGDGTFGYATSLRASLKFPFLSHRWDRLVLDVSGQTEAALDRLVPGDTPIPSRRREVAVGVGLTLMETLWTDTDARLGLLAGLPPGWYARLRLRHAAWIGEMVLSRLSLSGFWQTNTGWGTREEVDLDRLLAPWLFARLAAVGTLTERSRGTEWVLEQSLVATAGRSAFALAGGASGATDGGRVVEVWRVLARARRDVWRRWLFLELEPQVTWTRHPGGGREREEVVFLRLDIVFEQRPQAACEGCSPTAP